MSLPIWGRAWHLSLQSVDGGETWFKIDNGLYQIWVKSGWQFLQLTLRFFMPQSNLIAARAVYRTSNSGGSWTKMSDTVSGGTDLLLPRVVASPPF